MKIFSLFFIANLIYEFLNIKRLSLRPHKREYKSLFIVFFDIIYFLFELFYFLWIIGLLFVSTKLGILFVLLEFTKWFILKDKKNWYILIKLILLIYFFIS